MISARSPLSRREAGPRMLAASAAFCMATFAWHKWHVHESNRRKRTVLTVVNAFRNSVIPTILIHGGECENFKTVPIFGDDSRCLGGLCNGRASSRFGTLCFANAG